MVVIEIGSQTFTLTGETDVQTLNRVCEAFKADLNFTAIQIRNYCGPDRSARTQAFIEKFHRQRLSYRIVQAMAEYKQSVKNNQKKETIRAMLEPLLAALAINTQEKKE